MKRPKLMAAAAPVSFSASSCPSFSPPDIHESLRPVAVASRSSKPIGDRMMMNAAYLVERAREQEFDAAVKALSQKYEDLLSFKYTGPWPPYNFVNIKLKLERADS
jgi:hypothetical protein